MIVLRRPDGTISPSSMVMEKGIYDFYSNVFDSQVYLPTCHLRQDGYVIPSITPSTDLKFVRRQFNRVMAKERKCSFLVERFNSLRSSPNPSCFALQHDLNEVDMGEDATEIGCREAMRYRILHKKFLLFLCYEAGEKLLTVNYY
ncbi:hypothetical protein Y032_0068g139 [Ancylostoma ceylanicum]|uniref:Uncharacterized protein n=1 Tax=Ancylostoma ceylanicum TaxID=53326 RepID=A0A016TYD6_9BILA|nr:hypothetical protein Y032_0068g139 [Ancylostoma ceylanicum]